MNAAKTEAVQDSLGTGRRKTAVARVRVRAGNGQVVINERPLEQYFPMDREQSDVLAPLVQADRRSAVNVSVQVHGGGITSQAGAIKLGIARALLKFDAELSDNLRHSGLLTRDGRMKERKKYGLRGARRGTQFSKR